jgi:hypothetical protein
MIERSKPLDSNMEFIELSGTPLVVSRIGLGTWAIGGWMWGGTDEAQSGQSTKRLIVASICSTPRQSIRRNPRQGVIGRRPPEPRRDRDKGWP